MCFSIVNTTVVDSVTSVTYIFRQKNPVVDKRVVTLNLHDCDVNWLVYFVTEFCVWTPRQNGGGRGVVSCSELLVDLYTP